MLWTAQCEVMCCRTLLAHWRHVCHFPVQASAEHGTYLTTVQGLNLLFNQWPAKSRASKSQSLRHFRTGFGPGSGKAKPTSTVLAALTEDAKVG